MGLVWRGGWEQHGKEFAKDEAIMVWASEDEKELKWIEINSLLNGLLPANPIYLTSPTFDSVFIFESVQGYG